MQSNDTSDAERPVARLECGELLTQNLPLFRETSGGLVKIEAESMRLLDPMSAQTHGDDPTAHHIEVDLSHSRGRGSALCRFTITEPDEYEIWARAFGGSGEANSFYASIDQSQVALSDVTRLEEWHWLRVKDREETDARDRHVQRYRLKPGIHILQIRNRESGTKIDKLIVVRAELEFDPGDAD